MIHRSTFGGVAGEPCDGAGRAGRPEEQGLGVPAAASLRGDDRCHLARPALDRLVDVVELPWQDWSI
eukprot:5533380-Alexandrium_andersonii.AAC.1